MITNGYLSLVEAQSDLGISDSDDDTRIERAVTAASRLIDEWCGQRFWQDPSDTTRYFTPHNPHRLLLTSGSYDVKAATVTSVTSVAVDTTGDGTFDQTWTEGTHFFLSPRGAATSVRPYDTLEPLQSSYRLRVGAVDSVEIVGVFGWPAVPAEVKEACAIQSQVLFKRATEGAVPIVSMDGTTLQGGSKFLDREAQLLLLPFRRFPAVA